jgi:hypothetical protein
MYADQPLLIGHMFEMLSPNEMDSHTLNPEENITALNSSVLALLHR